MKHAFSKEYKTILKIALKSKLNGKNKIMTISTWEVVLLRYSGGEINLKVRN